MDVDELFNKLAAYQKRGYYLNPDMEFTNALIESLLVNEERYGYQACPCRLASGVRAEDLDIICPCDYRDADTTEFGSCFCGLYVSKKMFTDKGAIRSIPERRPSKDRRDKVSEDQAHVISASVRASKFAGIRENLGTNNPSKERKSMTEETKQPKDSASASGTECCDLEYPVWRCDVCGYLCARDEAPDVCPICGVSKDRFHKFM